MSKNTMRIAVSAVVLAAMSASGPAAAQKKFPGAVKAIDQVQPVWLKNLLHAAPAPQGMVVLTATCEVVQGSKTAFKPPYYPYRTGGISFVMSGSVTGSVYVNNYGNPSIMPSYSASVPQPSKSNLFVQGKETAGAQNDGNIVLTTESTPIVGGTLSLLNLPMSGSGILPILNADGTLSHFYRWVGTLNCPVGWV